MIVCPLLFPTDSGQYQPPVFKIVHKVTGLKLTAGATGQPITLEAEKDDPTQKW